MTHPGQQQGESSGRITVGILTDPAAMPALIGEQLAKDLPRLLAEQVDPTRTWVTDRRREQLPPSDSRHTEMMELAENTMREQGWDMAVCVTDLPIRSGKQAVMGDMNTRRRVVVISLPAFGVRALRRRTRAVATQLIADIHRPGTPEEGSEQHERRRLPLLARRFRRHTPDQLGVDARISAKRGDLRLLLGLVRANRPWRLVWGLTGPLAGAFAFSASYLINATVWDLGPTLTVWRLALAAVGAVSVMTGWLTIYHHLWEPVRERPQPEREQAVLFNATTVLTLGAGVSCMYVVLCLVNMTLGLFLLPPETLDPSVAGEAGVSTYVLIPLLVTTAATAAGAIGSGFESEESVRNAAFSLRERERREAFREKHERRRCAQQEDEVETRD